MPRWALLTLTFLIASCDDSEKVEKGSGDLYYEVSQLADNPGIVGQEFKVHGSVEAGTIRDLADHTQFTLREGGATIIVKHRGPLPDLFRDGAEVVAVGRLQADGSFASHELMAKCPDDYKVPSGPGMF